MKLTNDCPVKNALFKHSAPARKSPPEAHDDLEMECCLYQFLVFLFFHCKAPEAMLRRLAETIKREQQSPAQ